VNVRVIIASSCVAGALLALVWPSGAVRVAASMFAAVAGAILLDGLLRALHDVGPLHAAPAQPASSPAAGSVAHEGPHEMNDMRREIDSAPLDQPMPDMIFARVQLLARQRVRARLRLDPTVPADHAALVARLPPQTFMLVTSGLVADPMRTRGDAPLLRGYVPYSLRPPMSALPQLIEEMESL
jgi:hypothetical protein